MTDENENGGSGAPSNGGKILPSAHRFNPDEPEWLDRADPHDPRSIEAHLRERNNEARRQERVERQVPSTPVDALKPDGGVGLPRGSLLPELEGAGREQLEDAERTIAMDELDGIFDPYFHPSARARGRGRPTKDGTYRPAPAAAAYPSYYDGEGKRVQVKRLTHRHLAIMDYMLANPRLSLGELALYFGVTPAWLSTVRNSDLFKSRLHERRKEMEQQSAMGIHDRMVDMANQGITELEDAMKDEETDARFKLDATKMALESIGFLGKGKTSPTETEGRSQTPIQINVFEQAREAASAGTRRPELIEQPAQEGDE